MSKRKSATVATGKDKPGCASVNCYAAGLMKPLSQAIKRLAWLLDYPDENEAEGIEDALEDLKAAEASLKEVRKYLTREARRHNAALSGTKENHEQS